MNVTLGFSPAFVSNAQEPDLRSFVRRTQSGAAAKLDLYSQALTGPEIGRGMDLE
jgi:hypothetical protein